eukprot:928284_1
MVQIKVIITILLLFITTTISQHAHEHIDEIHDENSTTTDLDDHNDHDENTWTAIGITTFAGCASFLGAFAMFFIKPEYIGIMPATLAFAAGVTIYLALVNLIPESINQFHHAFTDDEEDESPALADVYTLLCVICGVGITYLLEVLFGLLGVDPHEHSRKQSATVADISPTDSDFPVKYPDFAYAHNDNKQKKQLNLSINVADKSVSKPNNYSHVSYSVAFALILHHFPEGIATFVSLYHDLEFGVLVAFALALHDIPSGICISVPMYLSSGSKTKPFILCFIAAIVYPIGAFIGWFVIENSSEQFLDIFIAILFGVTGG